MKPLSDKQQRFVDEYLIDLNASAAYKRAGYKGKGQTADTNAARMLRNAHIAKYVQAAMDKRSEKRGRDAADVLRDIEAVKMDAMVKVFDKDGNAVMLDRSAALKALELEGRHRKMFTDKIDMTANVTTNEATLDDLA